jgi:AraC family ethanolamine operon transcriptional activator
MIELGRHREHGTMIAETSVGQLPQDLILLSTILKICDIETVVLGAPHRRAVIDSETCGDAIFCNIETDFPFRGRFAVPTDWCVIGCVHETQKAVACSGVPLTAGMAFTVLPSGISECVFGPDSRVTLMLIPLVRLQRAFAEMVHVDLEMPARLLSLFNITGTPVGLTLRSQFEKISQYLTYKNRPHDAEAAMGNEVELLLQNHLLAGLRAQTGDRPQCTRGRRAHYAIVQRAEQFMRENMRRVIYLDEMCGAAGVSERALRYAFEDLFEVSPNRYLSMLRLCTAFRALASADSSRRSVKSVALSCGLWDLSRFAEHYRIMFGELPRDTLMRKPAAEIAAPSGTRETAYG